MMNNINWQINLNNYYTNLFVPVNGHFLSTDTLPWASAKVTILIITLSYLIFMRLVPHIQLLFTFIGDQK